jgi:hypothetical protein
MKKYTEKERRQRLALVRSFPKSGLSRAEFCRCHDLPVSTFDYWRHTARLEGVEGTVDGHFVEVHVEDAPQETERRPEMEVELPYGVKLRFFGVCQAGRR